MGPRTLNFTAVIAPVGIATRSDSIRQDVDMATVRVNYRFGGPIVARYCSSPSAGFVVWKGRPRAGLFACVAAKLLPAAAIAHLPDHFSLANATRSNKPLMVLTKHWKFLCVLPMFRADLSPPDRTFSAYARLNATPAQRAWKMPLWMK